MDDDQKAQLIGNIASVPCTMQGMPRDVQVHQRLAMALAGWLKRRQQAVILANGETEVARYSFLPVFQILSDVSFFCGRNDAYNPMNSSSFSL
ncbi:MAG: hypothetical protein WCH04_22235 [Gammaproteobacteria bacterium]